MWPWGCRAQSSRATLAGRFVEPWAPVKTVLSQRPPHTLIFMKSCDQISRSWIFLFLSRGQNSSCWKESCVSHQVGILLAFWASKADRDNKSPWGRLAGRPGWGAGFTPHPFPQVVYVFHTHDHFSHIYIQIGTQKSINASIHSVEESNPIFPVCAHVFMVCHFFLSLWEIHML